MSCPKLTNFRKFFGSSTTIWLSRKDSNLQARGIMYNRHFGFLESPFSITPDPRFFYANPVYLEAYANLRYGIDAKKGFIVIIGEVGTGKTTLLRKLMRELESTIHFAFIFNTDLTFNEVLRVTLRDLGLSTQGKDRLAMVDELNAYLIKQLKKGHIVCLLIDEVQNLSDESLEGLRLLSNLETDKEKLLQIVLMGQPELNVKLDKPSLRQLKQRIAIQCEIAPLKEDEVGSYINFRLRVAGYEGKDLFDREALQNIAFYSKGIPRLINILCDNALVIAFAASRKTVSAHVIREVAGDLRLESEAERTEAKNTFTVPVSNGERETPIREAPNRVSQHKVRNMVRAGVGIFLVMLVFVVTVSLTRSLDLFKHNLNQWVLPVTRQKIIPQKVNAEAENAGFKNAEIEFKWKEHRVIVQYGSTIYKIASDAYGVNAVLGMDLIKELNPQIQNLNSVSAGQELLLPVLTSETLLRQQPDGSYRLIVASFLSRTGADEAAGRIGKEGYQVIIIPKRVSNDLLLHRLEIDGLKNLEEATQTLETGLKNQWLTFAGKPRHGDGSQADITY
jgi:general secretion pathway protein A